MTVQYRSAPTYTTPLQIGSNIAQAWWRWIQATEQGVPPGAEMPITVGASPFTYTAGQKGFVIVSGGTVSAVHFVRTASYSVGVTHGAFPLSAGDQLVVTYSGKPTMTFVPQ